jgi:hypothetical protein
MRRPQRLKGNVLDVGVCHLKVVNIRNRQFCVFTNSELLAIHGNKRDAEERIRRLHAELSAAPLVRLFGNFGG